MTDKDSRICARLLGRLGNQPFQYATARNLAKRHCVELVLVAEWLKARAKLSRMVPRTLPASMSFCRLIDQVVI
ncbi:MAG: hypothetical protein OXE85_05715 [Roseovarius sp.]|nr:hypothetical protein [Roseovarius sp.]